MDRTRFGVRTSGFSVAAVAAAFALVVTTLVVPATSAAASANPCGVGGNPIECENTLPGTDPGVWDISGAGDLTIQGFSTDISVNAGSQLDFKVKTDAAAYTITIYRTGWYGGLGARRITTVPVSAPLPQSQPACVTDAATELVDCGNWAVSAGWAVPSTAVSGVYLALLRRTDTGGESQITFVVRNDASHSDLVLQTSDPTWQAYNTYGGSDFYEGGSNGRAYKVSYNRPVLTRGDNGGRDSFFGAEYPMVRFLERNGYDVTYQAGVDTARAGGLLTNHRVFVSVGHDEYWSGPQRANVEAARDAGVNLAFFSGNEVYWRTRLEGSIGGTATPNRTLVSYKETWANLKIDPSSEWTGTWRDPRLAPVSAGGGRPENGLTGTLYMSNDSDLPVTVKGAEGALRLWRNTGLNALGSGQSAVLAAHTIGYESDEDLDNGARPAGLIRMSTTTGAVPQYLQDFGSTTAAGTTTHHLTEYRAPSGALVFSAGTIQWSWGLDQQHDGNGAPADARMQQATVNLLADMDAQPASLMSGLVAATASADTTAPTATITSPVSGAAVANGTQMTATGTATDTGGGVVAAVEVSTDGGTSWHPASGTTSWTYSYIQAGNGATDVRARAVDDSANIGVNPAVTGLTVACPCSVFGLTVPAIAASSDTTPVELGLRVTPTLSGFISGVRFYKGTGNGGTHTGSLWSSAGARLATVTFTGESATGWQTASFAAPVAVTAGQAYVVSYTAPQGHYAVKTNFFSSAGVSAPPFSVAGGFGAAPPGVYGVAGSLPTQVFEQSNYYVDAVFATSASVPFTASGLSPVPGATSVPVTTALSAVFNKAVQAGSSTLTLATSAGQAVAGAAAYNPATLTVSFVPSAALASDTAYTATVGGLDASGGPLTGVTTWSFTTATAPPVPGACPCSVFDDTTLPTVVAYPDQGPVTVGMRFSATVAGTVAGVRFYKGAGNTGTHTGALWSATGTQLATATFTGESATGWQTVTFAQPVAITANTEYYASYRAPVGRYSVTLGTLANGVVRAPLQIVPNGGAYSYPDAAPLNASPTNYFVDVVFQTGAATPVVASTTPAAGAIGVATGTSVSATFSAAVNPGATLALTTAGVPVTGATTLSSDQRTLTFQPAAALAAGATYAATVNGATSVSGSAVPPVSWSFTTAGAVTGGCPCSLFDTQVPETAADGDASAVELGVSFTPNQNGTVTGVRFYKGAGNGGTHTGSLWSAAGARLATVQFTGEGLTGWQTATFAAPVTVTSGTTYVVSYLAPQGHYAVTQNFFTGAWVNGPLTAPAAGNGRYVYGGGFPTGTWLASNYFVDAVFQPASTTPPPTPTVVAVTPAAGATGVSTATTVTATLSNAPGTGTPALALSGPGGAIAGVSSFNAGTGVVTFAPAATLPLATVVSATVTLAGTPLVGGAWSFTTAAAPPPTPTVVAVTPAAGATGVSTATPVTATLSNAPGTGTPALALSGPGGAIAGVSSFNAGTGVVTFTPAAVLPQATVVSATVTLAGTPLVGGAWSFTTADAPPPPVGVSLWTAADVPATANWNDPNPVQVGVRVTTSVAGSISAIKFYKGPTNTGTHTVNLWSSTGALLATAPSSGESASGWQTVLLAQPVVVTAGQTVTASYYSTSGLYSATIGGLAAVRTVGPLSTVANGGAYIYGTGFPAAASGANYWVDVVFTAS